VNLAPSRIRSRLAAVASAAALVALAAAPPAAAAGLSLGWLDCGPPSGPGVGSVTYGCLSELVELPLFPGFRLAAPVDSVIAFELVLDADVADAALPEWWHMEPGGCRASGWAADATPATSCLDPWAGQGVAAYQGWIVGEPAGSARHGRLLVAAAVGPGGFVRLEQDQPYTACRVLLRTNRTLSCAGCTTPACLVFNSLLIRRLPGSNPEELLLSGADLAGGDRVLWQGGAGADCQSVPVRRRTWGAVKALYR